MKKNKNKNKLSKKNRLKRQKKGKKEKKARKSTLKQKPLRLDFWPFPLVKSITIQ